MKNLFLPVGLLTLALFAPGHSAAAAAPTTAASAAGVLSPLNARERLEYALKYEDSTEDKKTDREPTEIWSQIENSGWPEMLSGFQQRFRPGRSYLTLFKKLPLWPIDMRSPDRFKRSMSAKEIANKSSIGHMSIGWSCNASGVSGIDERSEDNRRTGFAAQTGEDGQQSEMLNDGWGVTSMISTFTDGHLQNGPEVQRYFTREYRNFVKEDKRPNDYFALVVEVPELECENVRAFVKNYVLHPSKPYRYFGMLPDPLKFEGAGCGSFAVAALSKAATLTPILAPMWRTVPIAEKLLGKRTRVFLPNDVVPAVVASTQGEEKRISKYQLVFMNWDAGKTALRLHLVDPELTIFAFKKFTQIAGADVSSLKRIYQFPSGNQDSGNDNKDAGFQEIDAEFDPSFGRVSTEIEKWWSERRSQLEIRVVNIPLGSGVMIKSKFEAKTD